MYLGLEIVVCVNYEWFTRKPWSRLSELSLYLPRPCCCYPHSRCSLHRWLDSFNSCRSQLFVTPAIVGYEISYLGLATLFSHSPWSSWNEVKVAQLCLTLCDLVDYTVHGILQARILEWVAFPFSRGSSQPRDRTRLLHCRRILYQLSHQGSCLELHLIPLFLHMIIL